MKLSATITSDTGKQRIICADKRITIELKHKNARVKHLQFKIEEGSGGHNWEFVEIE